MLGSVPGENFFMHFFRLPMGFLFAATESGFFGRG